MTSECPMYSKTTSWEIINTDLQIVTPNYLTDITYQLSCHICKNKEKIKTYNEIETKNYIIN